jgi:hypothetical protein
VNNLKHNLLSISQLYDKGYKIMFDHALRVWINSWHWWGIVTKRKNLKKRTSSSGVIAWCGFINGIISFTWISKRVQYSSMVGTWGMDVS